MKELIGLTFQICLRFCITRHSVDEEGMETARSATTKNNVYMIATCIYSEENLGICTVENLGPRGAKHKVFKIKRN